MKPIIKEMAKQEYDYLWIAKRLELLVENQIVYIGEPILKIKYCDQEYLLAMKEEADEALESLTMNFIRCHIQRVSYLPKDFPTFVDYVKQILSTLVSQKLKLHQDECISYFKIEYEKNMPR